MIIVKPNDLKKHYIKLSQFQIFDQFFDIDLDLNDVSTISAVEETTFIDENSTITTIATGVSSGKPI